MANRDHDASAFRFRCELYSPQDHVNEWRVGKSVKLNVYRGDTPICQCHDEASARFIVDACNAMAKAAE